MKDSLKALVGTVAPTIATALGGPLAGAAVSALSNAIFGTEGKSVKDIEKALTSSSSPETLLALKKADLEFETKMAELGVDLERIAQEDRASARQREEKVGGYSVPLMAFFILFCFFGAVGITLLGYSQIESALAGTLIGFLAAKAEQVVSYYFGSSAGSVAKNKMLEKR
jgi:Flp pilus assembly protein TadB